MKKIILIFLATLSLFVLYWVDTYAAPAIEMPGTAAIEQVSLNVGTSSGNIVEDVNSIGFRILTLVKRILMGVLVIFMVYIWAVMIWSMWSDEEALSSSKRQLWYAVLWILFINIPGTIYRSFYKAPGATIWSDVSWAFTDVGTDNLFFNMSYFWNTLNNQIIWFLEVMVFLAAVFMITLAGIQVMTSRGRDEKMTEAKNKILYTVLALIFVSIIEAWKSLAFNGQISDGVNLFESLANLALFFAAPIAMFFLTLAGYYYITSNGDEERTKKAKSIIINTLLASLILIASYTFLIDLKTLVPAPPAPVPVVPVIAPSP